MPLACTTQPSRNPPLQPCRPAYHRSTALVKYRRRPPPRFTLGLPILGGLLIFSRDVRLHPPLSARGIVALSLAQIRGHLGDVLLVGLLQFWRTVVSQILPYSGHSGAS